MKKVFSRRLWRRALLGGWLWLMTFHCSVPTLAQTSYATPYTFTTLPSVIGDTNRPAQFANPRGVAVDAAGNIYVANTRAHTICRLTTAGVITILAGKMNEPGNTDGTGGAARFCYPQSVAVDSAGNIFVADSGNNTIRRVTPTGVVTTLAGQARSAGSADGKGNRARFDYPNGVAVDGAGNIFVADLFNTAIRKVTPDGVVTTLAGQAGCAGSADGKSDAARFNFPVGVAVDGADNVYVADINNNAIRKVTATGIVTTLAGRLTYEVGSADGSGSAAQFNHPCGVATDGAGNVFVTDTASHTIRRITPSGMVTTLAGLAGDFGNVDGTGRAARFGHPISVAVDRNGNLYVADLNNGTIRKGFPASQTTTAISSKTSLSFANP